MHVMGARTIAENEDVRRPPGRPLAQRRRVRDRAAVHDRRQVRPDGDGRRPSFAHAGARAADGNSHYGRQRVGCEILQITDDDRRRIAELTSGAPGTAARRAARPGRVAGSSRLPLAYPPRRCPPSPPRGRGRRVPGRSRDDLHRARAQARRRAWPARCCSSTCRSSPAPTTRGWADDVLGRAEAPGGTALGRRPVPLLGRRIDPRQPGAGAGRGRARAATWSSPGRCTSRCSRAWCWPVWSRSGCGREVDPASGLATRSTRRAVARGARAAPGRRGRCSWSSPATSACSPTSRRSPSTPTPPACR